MAGLIQTMTLGEKTRLCIGTGSWTTAAVESAGIPQMLMADGPHGVRRVEDVRGSFKSVYLRPVCQLLTVSFRHGIAI